MGKIRTDNRIVLLLLLIKPITQSVECQCVTEIYLDDDAFQVGSSCYKVHKESAVNWFTAVNRCRSKNASLAVFNDSVTDYFPSSLLSGQAWIGLLKTRWTWPALSKLKLALGPLRLIA